MTDILDDSFNLNDSLSFSMNFSTDMSALCSPMKSKPVTLDQSFSAIQAMFDSSDSEVDPSEIEANDYYIPPSKSRLSESSFIEKELNENIVKLSDEDEIPHTISEIIVKYWFQIDQFEAGIPGKALAVTIMDYHETVLKPHIANKIYTQLDDIRTTISVEDNMILFYLSSIELYNILSNMEQFTYLVKKLAEKAVESVAKAFGGKIVAMISEMLTYDQQTPQYEQVLSNMKNVHDNFLDKPELYQNIIEFADCAITNMIITDKLLTSIEEFIWANTNLTIIEEQLNNSFNRFRQALLAVVAHKEILTNPSALNELIPLLPHNFIYFMFCMQDFISYQQVEAFAQNNHLNFNVRCDDFLFKPRIIVLPSIQ